MCMYSCGGYLCIHGRIVSVHVNVCVFIWVCFPVGGYVYMWVGVCMCIFRVYSCGCIHVGGCIYECVFILFVGLFFIVCLVFCLFFVCFVVVVVIVVGFLFGEMGLCDLCL